MKARYIDSLGNDIYRSTYESFLAQNILNHPESWKGLYDRLNDKIIELIKLNKDNEDFTDTLKRFKKIFGVSKPDEIIQALQNKNPKIHSHYPNQFAFSFYKAFFEWAFEYAILPPNKKTGKAVSAAELIETVRETTRFRPATLFTESKRGRFEDKEPEETLHAGILSNPATPPELKRQFTQYIQASKFIFSRNKKSPTVVLMEEKDLPFIAGPSGSLGYFLACVQALMGDEIVTEDKMKTLLMPFIANLVFNGHHSFPDVGLVIDALKSQIPGLFKVDVNLPVKEYYDQFLSEEYLLSDAYHRFYTDLHPNKYSALTWEILADSMLEISKPKASKLFAKVAEFIEQEKKAEQAKNSMLQQAVSQEQKQGQEQKNSQKPEKKGGALTGELNLSQLEKLRYILKEHAPLLKNLKGDEVSEEIIALDKLVKKFVDSGFLLMESPSPLMWMELVVNYSRVVNKNFSQPVTNFLNFIEQHHASKGPIKGEDLEKLTILLNQIKFDKEEKELTFLENSILSLKNKVISPNVASIDGYGYTPLLHAVDENNLALTRIYLEAKGNINDKTPLGYTPLHVAMMKGNEAVGKLLLEAKADINAKSEHGFSPLELAIMYGKTSCAKMLVDKGAHTHFLYPSGEHSFLLNAVQAHNTEAIPAIIAAGVDLTHKVNVRAAHLAAAEGYIDVLELLVKNKADLNREDNRNNRTPLHYAVSVGQTQVVKWLAECKDCKVDLNARDSQRSMTPAQFAVMLGKINSLRVLAEQGADLSLLTKENNSLNHLAIRSNEFNMLKYLAECDEYKCDYNQLNADKKSSLTLAIELKQSDMLIFMLSKMKPQEFERLQPSDKAYLIKHRLDLANAFITYSKKIGVGTEQCNDNIKHVIDSDNLLGVILNKTGSYVPSLFSSREHTKKIDLIIKELKYEPKQQLKRGQV